MKEGESGNYREKSEKERKEETEKLRIKWREIEREKDK